MDIQIAIYGINFILLLQPYEVGKHEVQTYYHIWLPDVERHAREDHSRHKM